MEEEEWVRRIAITVAEWASFGIDTLHAGHWIQVGEQYWRPAELSDYFTQVGEAQLAASYADALRARRAERPFVLSLVRLSGMALESASVDLRADHEVVMAAVSQTGEALQCTRIAQHPRVCASRNHEH